MNQERQRLIRELRAPAVLLLATLGFFWRILWTPDAWKPAGGGDLVSFLFPVYRFAASSLRAGTLPLWNPHLYGGAPFLADMQTGLFYPLNLLLSLLAPHFSYKTMEWLAVIHVFLAGLFMYLCLRYLEPNRQQRMHIPAALLGAVAFMFSDLFIVHFGNLNLVAVAAWLPLIFLLFWRALRMRGLGWAVWAGVSLAIATLAGHLQITLYVGLALAVVAVVEAMPSPPHAGGTEGGRAWPLLALAVTAVVAVGLSALVLLPAFEYTRLSPRAALPYRDAARFSLVPGLLGEMLVPALFNSREPSLYWGVWDRVAVGYLGVFPLVLAGLAVLLPRRPRRKFPGSSPRPGGDGDAPGTGLGAKERGRRAGARAGVRALRALAVLAVVAFLLALGSESVFHGWVYRLLPGFGQLRAPARLVLLLDFSLAALAALALDRLLGPLERRARRAFEGAWRGLLWFGGAAAIVGGAWAYLVIYQAQDRDPTLFWRVSMAGSGVIFALLMLGAGLAWLGARRSGRLRRKTLAWLAVGLVFVDLASVGATTDLGDKPPTSGYDHPLAVQYLQSAPGFFRIDSRTDVADVWQPDLALLTGLDDVNGVDNPLVVADVARYWEGTGGRVTRLYDFLGVRYVIASKDVTLDWDKFSLAFDADPAVNVYWNQTALPRAFVVHRAVAASDHEDAWARIHQPGFDPAASVVLEGGQSLDLQADAQAQVEMVRYEANSLELAVASPADGYLVLSDPFYPGWRAEMDGQPVDILRANYAFRAVPVPAGSHRLTMTFRSGAWQVGLVISGLTVLLLLSLGGVALARRRSHPR